MKNQLSLNSKKNQLKSINPKLLKRRKHGIFSGIALACLALLSINTIQAQDTRTQSNTTEAKASTAQESFIVKGNVSDNLEPIPGVNIVLEGTETGTVTDMDGNFEFPEKLKKGDVLVFSYVSMESQKVVIENKESASDIALNVNMKLDTVIIMGKVAIKGVYKSNRNK